MHFESSLHVRKPVFERIHTLYERRLTIAIAVPPVGSQFSGTIGTCAFVCSIKGYQAEMATSSIVNPTRRLVCWWSFLKKRNTLRKNWANKSRYFSGTVLLRKVFLAIFCCSHAENPNLTPSGWNTGNFAKITSDGSKSSSSALYLDNEKAREIESLLYTLCFWFLLYNDLICLVVV